MLIYALTFLMTFLFSAGFLQANEYQYFSKELVLIDQIWQSNLDFTFREKQFFPIVHDNHGIPSLGINQIYLSGDSFISFKYEPNSNIPSDKLLAVHHGYLYHLKTSSNKILAFYFSGVPEVRINNLIDSLKKRYVTDQSSTSYQRRFHFLNTAHANDSCGLSNSSPLSVTKTNSLETISQSTIAASLLGCLKGMGTGTTDAVLDIPRLLLSGAKLVGNELKEWMEKPSAKADQYYSTVEKGVTGFKNFVAFASKLLMNPQEGKKVIQEKFGETGEYLGGIMSSIASLPTEMAIEMLCSFVAGIGVDAIITIFTVGSAGPKLLLTLRRMFKQVDKLSDLFKYVKKLNLKGLDQLGLDKLTQNKLFKAMNENKVPEKYLDIFSQSVMSDSPLIKQVALRGLKCTL